jgi:DNA-binding transcriptional LysR family regulator
VCCEDELQVMCAPGHPLAALRVVEPRALAEHGFISREPGSGTREVVDHYLRKQGVPAEALHVVMEASSPEALKGLVATGVGFTIMSRATVLKEVRLGELVPVPLAPRLLRDLSLVYPKERIHSRTVNAFMAFARERLASAISPLKAA